MGKFNIDGILYFVTEAAEQRYFIVIAINT